MERSGARYSKGYSRGYFIADSSSLSASSSSFDAISTRAFINRYFGESRTFQTDTRISIGRNKETDETERG